MPIACSGPPGPSRPTQAGFSILEVLVGASILAIALLGHTASLFSEHRLSRDERMRSTALQGVEQFLERLRGDDDWPGLYTRLRTLQALASTPGGPVHLTDGRRAYPPGTYYLDFVPPRGLVAFDVLVDVPFAAPEGAAAAPILREDVTDARYGLPYDLNGDGLLDTADHAADYRGLPLLMTFRWAHSGEAPEEMRVALWLWGDRR